MKQKHTRDKREKKPPGHRWRMILVGVFLTLLYGGVGARAVFLHVVQGPWWSQKAARQYQRAKVTHGKRGTIYDTRMREMAVSIDTTSIAAFPGSVVNPQATAMALSKVLKLNPASLKRKLTAKGPFVWIKRDVAPKDVAAVKALSLAGIEFLPEHARVYPNRTLAAQLIGFSGIDGVGLEGLEFFYNDHLKGNKVKQIVMTDALGRGFDAEKQIMANYSGGNLILTVDRNVQYIAETALAEAATTNRARSGIAVVMLPKTGAILAMAHYPFFNPNSFEDYKRDQWRNRAITDPFEPGSTMKIFMAAGAIDAGICTPNTIFYCEDGRYRIGRNTIHDTHPHEWLTLLEIVKYSSNIGTVKVAEAIGRDLLHANLKAFGFGEKTGIDCPGETPGLLSSPSRWTRIDMAAISFGQGVSVSAVQLVAATAAIANDGVLMAPRIVKALTDNNGRLIQSFEPRKVRDVISPVSARTIRSIMNSVTTEGGTGVNAAIDGYSVCGKTGTAQKIDESGRYARGKYISSFIGFAPCESPEIVVLVILDEPREKHYGGLVAAPAFSRIVRETLNYMNITPEENLQPDWNRKMTLAKVTDTKK
ncbi:MAG: peptidoglycan D,D-transpeptidase FtsI family protein [Thermodesulfobacteriota bacterium]